MKVDVWLSLLTITAAVYPSLLTFHCSCAYSSDVCFILVPRATILLTCGRDRELWLCPTPEVRNSRTYCVQSGKSD